MYFGKKVMLRSHQPADKDKILNYLNNYDLIKLKSINAIYPWTAEDVEQKMFINYIQKKDQRYAFAIETLEEKKYIGWCGYLSINYTHRVAETGISIMNPDFWGNGYGSDAFSVLIQFLFNELNLRKVTLTVKDYNTRGQKCYEKLGFQVEGRLRKNSYFGGQYCDDIKMGMFREEFRPIH